MTGTSLHAVIPGCISHPRTQLWTSLCAPFADEIHWLTILNNAFQRSPTRVRIEAEQNPPDTGPWTARVYSEEEIYYS